MTAMLEPWPPRTDAAEVLSVVVEEIRHDLSIFNALEDVPGAIAFIASLPNELVRALAISIWRAERAKYGEGPLDRTKPARLRGRRRRSAIGDLRPKERREEAMDGPEHKAFPDG